MRESDDKHDVVLEYITKSAYLDTAQALAKTRHTHAHRSESGQGEGDVEMDMDTSLGKNDSLASALTLDESIISGIEKRRSKFIYLFIYRLVMTTMADHRYH
jgi:hypothetical protein